MKADKFFFIISFFIISCNVPKDDLVKNYEKKDIMDRFIEYAKMSTESNPDSKKSPSSEGQIKMARYIEQELKLMGINDITLSDSGVLYAKIPSNTNKEVATVGFIAHFDTSPEVSGHNVKPVVHKNYNGENLVLNKKLNIVLDTGSFPEITKYKGQTIITSDGTTLLGADDKAGIAAIMDAIDNIVNNDSLEHGDVHIAFTPDEEIGQGTDNFDVSFFNADFAYTIDGGEIGELQYENFNAASVKVKIKGKNVHPGYAKGKMLNSIYVAREFDSMLPSARPENTEGYEGYYHLIEFNGEVEKSNLFYIIRDHDKNLFELKKKKFNSVALELREKYGDIIIVKTEDSYYNMKEKIEPVFNVIEIAQEAMINVGVAPKIKPIRGGTDGAMLSYKGLPCPNIFSGGHNFHSRFEFIPVKSMTKASETIIEIVRLINDKGVQ